jgi:type IV pilus assembly protein PilB
MEEYLLQHKLITEDALQKAKQAAHKSQQTLIIYLAKNNLIAADKLMQAIVEVFHFTSVDLSQFSVTKFLVDLIPHKLIMQTNILPLHAYKQQLDIALIDPYDLKSIELIKFHTGMKLNIFIARYDQLQRLMQKIATIGSNKDLHVADISAHTEVHQNSYNVDFSDQSDEPLIRFIDHVIVDAVHHRASDIHFEVYEQDCRVRFRQDGILHEVIKPPKHSAARIASRLKIMAKLDIAERRLPQDGHCKIKIGAQQIIEARVSSCPTIFGEKIVLRLLNGDKILRKISQLGFTQAQENNFIDAISRPQGLILVTGPTGSGKTVTLYAALQHLNIYEKNIATIEDPVEINLPNVNQVNVKVKIGLTFTRALRAFLRQDPDIIMIGEIRDLETAEIAIKAAQTGHLVIATLHTNNALETLTRLRNMGVAAHNVIGSLTLITAQRLVRKLCPYCKKENKVSSLLCQQFNFMPEQIIYEAVGCSHCVNGYFGRVGVHEVLPVDENFYGYLLKESSGAELKKLTAKNGFVSLQQFGLDLVAQGETTIQEILRVMGC